MSDLSLARIEQINEMVSEVVAAEFEHNKQRFLAAIDQHLAMGYQQFLFTPKLRAKTILRRRSRLVDKYAYTRTCYLISLRLMNETYDPRVKLIGGIRPYDQFKLVVYLS